MKIYISGPITGDPNYKEKFDKAETSLNNNYDVVNPTKVVPFDENKTWSDYMREDIKVLLECNAIYMMKGWQKSKGATLEFIIAKHLDMTIIYEDKK